MSDISDDYVISEEINYHLLNPMFLLVANTRYFGLFYHNLHVSCRVFFVMYQKWGEKNFTGMYTIPT